MINCHRIILANSCFFWNLSNPLKYFVTKKSLFNIKIIWTLRTRLKKIQENVLFLLALDNLKFLFLY